MIALFSIINSLTKAEHVIFKARDNSGFVVYNCFTGETKFSLTLEEQGLSEADLVTID